VHAGACAVKFYPFFLRFGGKPVNTIDAGAPKPQSESSMPRTPNAPKSIFAFVARISLR